METNALPVTTILTRNKLMTKNATCHALTTPIRCAVVATETVSTNSPVIPKCLRQRNGVKELKTVLNGKKPTVLGKLNAGKLKEPKKMEEEE